jgi:two-component sensor histidine kinase
MRIYLMAASSRHMAHASASEVRGYSGSSTPGHCQRQGFGTRVVNRVIQDLKGSLRFDWNQEGIACEIVVPVDQLAGST